MSEKRMTNYTDYLHLEALLEAQQPLSDHPDELHFILIHQIHELWFKLALHHLERACTAMQQDEILEAVRLIGQVSAIFENARHTAEHLHTLPPMAFHQFRQLLAPGSGLQSYQFREIEFLAGLRDKRHVEWVRRQLAKDSHWETVHRRLDEPSIHDVFIELLTRHQVPDIASIYADPPTYPEFYALADTLSILDQTVQRWRYSHIHLVQRTIGAGVMGTGGTTHDYLVSTLQWQLFPELWEARNILSSRFDESQETVSQKG